MRERRWLTQAPQIPTTLHPTALVLLRTTILWQHEAKCRTFIVLSNHATKLPPSESAPPTCSAVLFRMSYSPMTQVKRCV